MRLKKGVVISLTLVLINCSQNYKEQIEIIDIGIDQKHEVKFDLNENYYVDRIQIEIKGEVDDTVRVGRYFLPPGKVDTTFRQEWYSSNYIIDYNSKNATKGNVTITVEFIAY